MIIIDQTSYPHWPLTGHCYWRTYDLIFAQCSIRITVSVTSNMQCLVSCVGANEISVTRRVHATAYRYTAAEFLRTTVYGLRRSVKHVFSLPADGVARARAPRQCVLPLPWSVRSLSCLACRAVRAGATARWAATRRAQGCRTPSRC